MTAHDLVVLASRLPVDRVASPEGGQEWQPSPGGLVTALEPVMRETGGVWIGWSGDAGPAPGAFEANGLRLVGLGLSETEVRRFYEGFCNATLWPLYHDVIAPPQFHRSWWDAYVTVNRRYAQAAAEHAAPGATVWVHDYQLQLVPQMLREQRDDVRIGFFNHIPFPGYEIFAQLPWRRQVVRGLLGADLLGFQRRADATNFLRACRRDAGLPTKGTSVRAGEREIHAAAFPISVDAAGLAEIARRDEVVKRSKEIRAALGEPGLVLLGVDRLDYTKGILHRLRAYGELVDEERLGSQVVLIQVASPSRERVEAYQTLRDEVETMVSRINGQHGEVGYAPIHYLHQSYPREEMAALYLAADVMLVTPLRDGMNLVAKEYVACRTSEDGALVLSEFTGAADELAGAFLVNPHDIQGLKDTIVQAATISPAEARRRMRAMRRRVGTYDVARWAASFLDALRQALSEDQDMNTPGYVAAVVAKAEAGGVHGAELAALRRRLRQLGEQQAGLLPGDVLEPLADLPRLDELPEPAPGQARAVLDRLVIVKLNGGLGTSMGLSGPKSLLAAKPGANFLDILARQVLALRARYGARLPLVLMNSAITREPSLDVLRRYGGLGMPGVPADFLQGREPKIDADDFQPVQWPADPELEWCPPGHGDIYPALAESGTLDALLGAGLRYAFVSNSDNLGALADVRIAAWLAAEQVPFALEAVRGTAADRKGGHLACYQGRLVLRETAQVPEGDTSFTDVERWRWYNTNNIWIDLRALKDLQAGDQAAPDLPLIVNRKTVDPRDPESTPVIQLESAMGAAIGSVPGARALQVPRSRFAPVKTTDDLLVLRSDAYELTSDGEMRPSFEGQQPVVTLDENYYRLLPDFEQRFPAGAPSLRRCERFEVDGDVTFGANVVAVGKVRVTGPRHVRDGEVLGG